MTAFCGVLDIASGRLGYSTGGHSFPYVPCTGGTAQKDDLTTLVLRR